MQIYYLTNINITLFTNFSFGKNCSKQTSVFNIYRYYTEGM